MLIPIGDEASRRRIPFVNYLLIGANVAAFVAYGTRPVAEYEEIVLRHGLIPESWDWQDALTSMFLHAGWLHLLGNMLLLWISGDNIEDRFGHLPYLAFYLFSGGAAAAAQVVLAAPEARALPMIGASGAVAGTIGAYLVLFPRNRIKMLLYLVFIVHFFRVPAWSLILLWVTLEGLRAWEETQGTVTPIAVWAHLGGFAFGAGAALLWRIARMFRSRDETSA